MSPETTKTAEGVSANTVKAARSGNDAPKFADDQDPVMLKMTRADAAHRTGNGEHCLLARPLETRS